MHMALPQPLPASFALLEGSAGTRVEAVCLDAGVLGLPLLVDPRRAARPRS